MKTELCERFGIEYPIFVFTPSEKVAAAVSRAGGLGVLGCVRFNDADDLEEVLQWMDANTDGLPYGVDVVIHGHTHRPAVHEIALADRKATRIVLGDWYEQGSVLRWGPAGYALASLSTG